MCESACITFKLNYEKHTHTHTHKTCKLVTGKKDSHLFYNMISHFDYLNSNSACTKVSRDNPVNFHNKQLSQIPLNSVKQLKQEISEGVDCYGGVKEN